MFKREHHVRIATVLQALDAQYLAEKRCYFGGGTAIVLMHGEYRESIDIDFLVSNKAGYRDLRNDLSDSKELGAIFKDSYQIKLASDVRADQYGVRCMLNVGGVEIKFEIVHEGRIELETPGESDQVCGVTTLSKLDMATSKLLANSDRWADRSVFSRDLIDLAMLELKPSEFRKALAKASDAYGDSVEGSLNKAIESLKSQPDRLDECIEALKMHGVPKALLWEKIRRRRLGDA